jgi:ParB-like chromosome segregation protein Spo0J
MTSIEKNWPPYNVERRAVAVLAPYARNALTHSHEQVEQIAKSMDEFGWTMPVLVDEKDNILADHDRILAARKRGIEECPVIVARGWSEEQQRAYVLADNELTENAGWDDGLLKAELLALRAAGFDITTIGFAEKELVTFLAGSGGDETPPESQYSEQYGVIVICTSEAEQQAMCERLHGEGLNCRVVTT